MKKNRYLNKHLSLSDRNTIQTGIENGSTKAAIAQVLNKDPTTIAKEIRRHRSHKPRNTYYRSIICIHLDKCRKNCKGKCERYEEPKCKRRDVSPGACNKCKDYGSCKLDKYIYNAIKAEEAYQRELIESRKGFNLTQEQIQNIGQIIAPLLKQGQSPYQILSVHGKEINISIRSLYSYIEAGVFKPFGVDNFSLKEQVNRKQTKLRYKPRKRRLNLTGKEYKDYVEFRMENPDIPIIEMDTVMNSLSGPYVQTIILVKYKLMIGFIHKEKTSASMAQTYDYLQEILGIEDFCYLFPVTLVDRGVEFERYDLFEKDKDNLQRTIMFYCDPMNASQKPHVENNHNYVRDILPNQYNWDNLTQEDLNLVFSHINSAPRKSLGDKTPFETFSFFHNPEILRKLNIKEIERDKVVLKPSLLPHIKKLR